MKNRFHHALRVSNKIETKIANLFASNGYEVISMSNDNSYDFVIKKGFEVKTYEVKTDFFIRKDFDTGNMFIEYECRNKPSGISTTSADWYVYYYFNLDELWFIKTSDLKDLIEEYTFLTTFQSGDDNSNTRGYLIPRNEPHIKELFTIRKLC